MMRVMGATRRPRFGQWIVSRSFMTRENTQPKLYAQGQPDGCRIRSSGDFLGRLTTPRTAAKLNFVAPPLWGPSDHDNGQAPVNRNENSHEPTTLHRVCPPGAGCSPFRPVEGAPHFSGAIPAARCALDFLHGHPPLRVPQRPVAFCACRRRSRGAARRPLRPRTGSRFLDRALQHRGARGRRLQAGLPQARRHGAGLVPPRR